ncbi:hypothetical protein CK203_042697 [Vitis vinifera]|uniref:Reverse transcriptase domain-containing protein n=1 Tax=Vitis vinifera TaxID=29760 RepID=A0A438I6Y9_VITVI|nr:hypothetical protein CK203_042697 [Vitis vinifera]
MEGVSARSRLDRFLISEDWENHFSGVSQCILPRLVFDHFPFLLDGGGVRRGSIPFRFENMWLKEEGFKELLRGWWQGFNYSGLEFDKIGEEEAARMEEMFYVEEVFLAFSELNRDKAPSPDGFSLAFWQFCWDFVKGGADDLCDYRPISLVGGLYKLLAKVLANRLKKVVSPTQNAFVEGRQILDATLIANETIDSLLKWDEYGVLCKLDLEKAYNHINWDFLLTMMQKWVLGRNGLAGLGGASPRIVFGIRGRGGSGIQVSHLLFADDTLVFSEDSQQMAFLSWLLMWFEAISGLSINLNKSELLPMGRVENVEVLALNWAAKWDLSLPLIWGSLWVLLISQWQCGMVWKRGCGRDLPCGRGNSFPKGENHSHSEHGFPLGWGALEKRPHLVKWVVSFWKLIISRKFGKEGGGWNSREVREGYGVGFWKEIRKEAVSQDAWVADCWDSVRDVGGWIPCFSRPFNDWEVETVERLLSTLKGKRLVAGLEDRVLWKASKNGIFSVKSLYNTLESSRAVPFPGSIIWSPCVPTKVGFFAWEASWGKVLTQDQLKRRD